MPSDRFAIRSAAQGSRVRAGLRLGTALAGVLFVCGTAHAQAQIDPRETCGAPVDGVVNCAPDPAGYPNGIAYIIDPVAPVDLTINFDPDTVVIADGIGALVGGNLNGGVTINAGVNDFQTLGDSATAIFSATQFGDITIAAGNVATNGDNSPGIVTSTSRGTTTITAGDISTSGYRGVAASVLSTSGDVVIDLANVTTRGDEANGIEVTAYSGNVAVTAGTVATYGFLSDGINTVNFDGEKSTTITVGDILTLGESSRGIYAGGVGDVAITAGSVATYGGYSSAIDSLTITGDNSVSVGDVFTTGTGSIGVRAESYYGDVHIDADTVETRGAGALGVFAHSLTGDVTADIGQVTTSGPNAAGVVAYANYGTATVSVGEVRTGRDYAGGVFVAGGQGATLDVGKVVTAGYGSTGVQIVAGSTYSGPQSYGYSFGDAVLTVGSVETRGDVAIGVSATALGNTAVDVGNVLTFGDYSDGINISSALGDSTLQVDNVQTSGFHANAVYGVVQQGGLAITVGNLTTAGDNAQGIRSFVSQGGNTTIVVSGSIGTSGTLSRGIFTVSAKGNVNITNDGTITTTGDQAQGIRSNVLNGIATIDGGTINTSGAGSVGIDVFTVGDLDNGITVSADSVTTAGANAHGIWVRNPIDGVIGVSLPTPGMPSLPTANAAAAAPAGYDQDIRVISRTVAVTGQGAVGIFAGGRENVFIDATTTRSATAAAISVNARSLADVTIRGVTSGAGGAAVDIAGGDATLRVLAGGSIAGTVDGLRIAALGPCDYIEDEFGYVTCPTPVPSPGLIKIDNAGTITGGTGYAVSATAGTVTFTNSGRINGAIKFAGGNDLLTNAGIFAATKDSDFGLGNDRFVNTGMLLIRPGQLQPGSVTMLGLETFDNAGTVDLRNGAAGDVLTLPGAYIGRAGTLALDVDAAGVADRLVIGGIASGSTSISISPIGGTATLLAKPITVVSVGTGSATNAFTLSNADAGFIRYGLSYDAAARNYALITQAGAPVYRLLKLQEAAQALWLKSAESWTAHMADLRDAPASDRKLWFQASGGVETRKDSNAAAGYDLGLRQDYYGGEIGYDVVQAGDASGLSAGILAGYVSSNVRYQRAAERASVDAANIGGYLGLRSGVAFANLLAKYDRYWVSASNQAQQWADRFHGQSYGAQVEIGVRFGTGVLFVEPVATLAWQRTSLDDLAALGQTIDFDTASVLRGKLGGRIGGTGEIAGTRVVFYGGGSYAHEFKDGGGLRFLSGGVTERITASDIGDHGEGVLGLTSAIPAAYPASWKVMPPSAAPIAAAAAV
ncbi:autotransporter outer membrane beta-barrel domain-containing protein [Sphingomonas hylomeconis]|uniref:Autotransporter outer membrane beta-barrel domain-containing protein n=1 Tax=Sphingomonas hylomeconis TaxID=1395958 RepID=A0ABV7STY4_9SPHN|nr:autotransporter outer membrane beta-barrel domain-containing protein [Sphingomonas hylomeconis]